MNTHRAMKETIKAENTAKSKKWLIEINADWGRNITKRIYNEEPKGKESVEKYAQKIKNQFGDSSLESKIVDVKPI